jgi:hypothetical protein
MAVLNNNQMRIGIFKEDNPDIKNSWLDDNAYLLYLSDYSWKDFLPVVIDSEDNSMSCFTCQFQMDIDKSLDDDPLEHWKFVAVNFPTLNQVSPKTKRNLCEIFFVRYESMSFTRLNEKLQMRGDFPFDYRMRLRNNIEYSNILYDDCLIRIPIDLLPDYLTKLTPTIPHFKNKSLMLELERNLGKMLYLDEDCEIIKQEKIENFNLYKAKLSDRKPELIDLNITGDEEYIVCKWVNSYLNANPDFFDDPLF